MHMQVKLTACGTSHLQRWTNQNYVILAKYQWNHFTTNILISYTLFQQVYSSGGFFFKVEFCIGFSGKWQKAVKWQIEGMGIYHRATHTRTMALNCRHAGLWGKIGRKTYLVLECALLPKLLLRDRVDIRIYMRYVWELLPSKCGGI